MKQAFVVLSVMNENICKLEIDNIIAYAADIPLMDKEKKTEPTFMIAGLSFNVLKRMTCMGFIYFPLSNRSYAAYSV